MPWIIAIESGSPFPNGGGYVSKIGRDGTLTIVNNRAMAKNYQKKGLVDRTVQEVNEKGKILLKAVEISELRILRS